jgi:hypothetical protein
MQTHRTVFPTIIRHGFLAAGLILVLVFVYTVQTTSTGIAEAKAKRSIKFSHAYHVKEAGVACVDCHVEAATSVSASDRLLVEHPACQSCHEEQLGSNCTFCHTSEDTETYALTPNPRRELRFSHKVHVDQGATCEFCHGEINDKAPVVGEAVPSMAKCNTCHNDVKATNACEACHTNLASLRPREHNRTDFVKEHKIPARMGDAKCGACHTQESCFDCHNGGTLEQVSLPGSDLVSPRSPRLTAIDRGQGMSLVKMHDLNFRFTHGIAAKGKTQDCETCHSKEEFCATCHMAGGNVTQAAFMPQSHVAAGFKWGGHGTAAKRDIEACITCHDVQGADPTCIQCHMDTDGVRGTNPKFHPLGSLATNEGEWHEDPGVGCYACHTDSNARPNGVRGQRFCGYCHR